MGRTPVDNNIQADATVCNLNDVDHEEEVVVAFLVYVYGPSALRSCLENL
jgi:hypothetical protein